MHEVAEAGMNGKRSVQALVLLLLHSPVPDEWADQPGATVERHSSYKASPVLIEQNHQSNKSIALFSLLPV